MFVRWNASLIVPLDLGLNGFVVPKRAGQPGRKERKMKRGKSGHILERSRNIHLTV